MAKTKFTAEVTGLSEYIDGLGRIVEEFPIFTKESLTAQMKVVENAMKRNWVSLGGGKVGDFVYDSIGMNVEYGDNGLDSVGYVGVFHIDHIAILHGRVVKEGERKPMRAPQIAYWVEFGSQRLKSGERKIKNLDYPEEDLAKEMTGIPFMTNAGYTTVNEQNEAFKLKMDEILSRVMK